VSLEHLTRMDDEDLGLAVRSLEPLLRKPEPPDVASAVATAIRAGQGPRRRLSRPVRVAILVAAALLLLTTAAIAARLVIDVGGIRIEPPPATTPSVSPPPLVGPAFGEATTLAAAEREAGFRPVVPDALGKPDRVWIARGNEPGSILIAMAWLPRDDLPRIPGTPYGASLIEVHGDAELVAKQVDVRFVQLSHDVFWIRHPHQVELLTGGGTRTFIVTGHVLIWQSGDLALRLETDLPKAEALALAGRSR
jgi:hypothetical protein